MAQQIDRLADRIFIADVDLLTHLVAAEGRDGQMLRLAAVPLRRLIVDGEIGISAGPHWVKLRYQFPDNRPRDVTSRRHVNGDEHIDRSRHLAPHTYRPHAMRDRARPAQRLPLNTRRQGRPRSARLPHGIDR